tara:strand:+ start:692 stop:862 length:171 start_codon:yes stop_codon:yes gene_type:complete
MEKEYVAVTHSSAIESKRKFSYLFDGKLDIENILGKTLVYYESHDDLFILVVGSKV